MRTYGFILCIFVLILYQVVSVPNAYAYKAGDFEIDVTGKVSETYDDNIASVKDNKKDDFISTVAVGIVSAYESKATSFQLAGGIAHHFFAQYDNFDNTSVDFSANVTQDISKYDRLIVREDFLRAQDPSDLESEFVRIPGRYSYIRNGLSLEYSHDFTSQFAMNARYANETYIPSRAGLRDSYLNRFGIGGDYSFSSATVLLFDYDYFQRNFNPGDNAFLNVLSTGLRQYLTKQFYLEGKTGAQFIHSFNGKSFAKPLIIVSLVDDISKNTRYSLTCKKEYHTDPYTQDFLNSWEVFSQIAQQLTERSEIDFSGFYGKGKYLELGEKVSFKGLNLGFEYNIKENVKGVFSYGFTQTDSSNPDREYNRNKFDVVLNIKF